MRTVEGESYAEVLGSKEAKTQGRAMLFVLEVGSRACGTGGGIVGPANLER